MKANQMNTDKGYWLAWFLASAMGFGMGALLGLFFAYGIFNRDPWDITMGVTMGIVMGASGGYLQWVVLRERIGGAGWWGMASALGFALALAAVLVADTGENYVSTGVLIGFGFGLASGILQWLILRRKVPRAGWWILANLLGALFGAVALPIADALFEAGRWELGVMMFGLVFGACYGAITGVALVWLLRQSPTKNVERLATAH